MTVIERSGGGPSKAPEDAPTVQLDQRLTSGSINDPTFEAFYPQLIDLGASDRQSVLAFVKAFTDAQGEPVYRTAQAQVKVLQQALARMKEQGLEGSVEYEAVRNAFSSSFAANALIQQFMNEVFNPETDDDQDTSW